MTVAKFHAFIGRQLAVRPQVCTSSGGATFFGAVKHAEWQNVSSALKMKKSSQETCECLVLPSTSPQSTAFCPKTFLTFAAVNPRLRQSAFAECPLQSRIQWLSSGGFSSTSSVDSGEDDPEKLWREYRLVLQETRRTEEDDSDVSIAGEKNSAIQWSKIHGHGREENAVRICRALIGKKWWTQNIISALDSMKVKLEAYTVAKVLKQQTRLQVSLGFFYWAKEQKGYRHNTCVYNILIGTVGSKQDFPLLKRIMEEMLQDKCVPNAVTYTSVMKSFGASRIEKVVDTFEHMHEVGCAPDVATYNNIIDLLVKAGDHSKAWSFYQRMLKAGLKPDILTHNILYSSLVKSDRVDEACELPNACLLVSRYNSLIHFLGRAGKLNDALKVFQNMKSRGRPDNFTYSSLINFFGKGGDIAPAWALFQEMRTNGCIPDVVAYTTMMKAFRKAGKPDEVLSLYHAMKLQGCAPDKESYTNLIHSLVEGNKVDQSCVFLREMVAAGFKPNITTYSDVLWILGRAGKVHEAHEFFKQMRETWQTPRVNAYHAMIVTFSLAGRMEEALSVFKESKEVGCLPNSDMYSDLIHGLCKAGNVSSAEELFTEMIEKGFSLDLEMCNVLIKGLCKLEREDRALELLKMMPEWGCTPDVITYTNLIEGLLELDKEKLAFTLFRDMKERCCHPNRTTYNTLISFLCKRAEVEEAQKLLKEMEESGCTPDDFTIGKLKELGINVEQI